MLKYKPKTQNPFCLHPFRRVKIDAYGGVTHCCYQGAASLGNILDHDLKDIWEGGINKKIQKETLQGRLHPSCRTWGGCPFEKVEIKPAKHFDKLQYPLVAIELDLPPTHCNIGGETPDPVTSPACLMCCRNSEAFIENMKNIVSRFDETLEKIKPMMPGLDELSILGNAEPFWKDAIFKAFDKLDYLSYRNHCRFWTYTNGTLFGERTMKRYMEYVKTSSLNFSIDAATPETYIKLRRLNLYETIKQNIKRYSSCRTPAQMRRNVKGQHSIRIFNVLSRINFREMPLMVEEAEEMGADVVAFGLVHSAGGAVSAETMALLELTGEDREEYEKCEAEAKRIASKSRVEFESNLGLLLKDFQGQNI
jgi:MoaA/NifB/PqqE/SkfB family radical SAM enzyme